MLEKNSPSGKFSKEDARKTIRVFILLALISLTFWAVTILNPDLNRRSALDVVTIGLLIQATHVLRRLAKDYSEPSKENES